MSPYKIEILWQFDDEYVITILDKNNKEIVKYNNIQKHNIPYVLEKYLCVGDWGVK